MKVTSIPEDFQHTSPAGAEVRLLVGRAQMKQAMLLAVDGYLHDEEVLKR